VAPHRSTKFDRVRKNFTVVSSMPSASQSQKKLDKAETNREDIGKFESAPSAEGPFVAFAIRTLPRRSIDFASRLRRLLEFEPPAENVFRA
jgi:hypothetical protein